MNPIAKRLHEAHGIDAMNDAKRRLKTFDKAKVDYVRQAYEDVLKEYGKYGTDEEDQMHPDRVKDDWMLGAIEDDLMTEEEFDEIFQTLSDADDRSLAYT